MDMAAVKAKLAQLNNKGTKEDNRKSIWKPSDEHDIRLLAKEGADDPFTELYFHANIGANFPFLCPKNFGDECPVCEFAGTLAKFRDANGKDTDPVIRKQEFEVFKKIQAKPRYYVAMVERGKEAEGPKFWSITQRVWESLLKICASDDWNADRDDGGGANILVSPIAGHDLHVSYKKPGMKGNKTTMTLTDVEERKKPSKLMPDAKDAKKLISQIGDPMTVEKRVTTAEVHKMLSAWLNSGATEDTANAAAKKDVEYSKGEKKPAAHNAEKLTGTKTVEDALDDLINS